jgi:hypothetical protein
MTLVEVLKKIQESVNSDQFERAVDLFNKYPCLLNDDRDKIFEVVTQHAEDLGFPYEREGIIVLKNFLGIVDNPGLSVRESISIMLMFSIDEKPAADVLMKTYLQKGFILSDSAIHNIEKDPEDRGYYNLVKYISIDLPK